MRPLKYSTLYLASLLRRYPKASNRTLRPYWLRRYVAESGSEPADIRRTFNHALVRARQHNRDLESGVQAAKEIEAQQEIHRQIAREMGNELDELEDQP